MEDPPSFSYKQTLFLVKLNIRMKFFFFSSQQERVLFVRLWIELFCVWIKLNWIVWIVNTLFAITTKLFSNDKQIQFYLFLLINLFPHWSFRYLIILRFFLCIRRTGLLRFFFRFSICSPFNHVYRIRNLIKQIIWVWFCFIKKFGTFSFYYEDNSQ